MYIFFKNFYIYLYNILKFYDYRLVHSECDPKIDAAMLLQMKNEEATDYLCTICRNRDPEVGINQVTV
jgi:hypothetical protein